MECGVWCKVGSVECTVWSVECTVPRKMTMEFSKVLRLPRQMQLIFCQRPSIAPATQKTTFDTWVDTWEYQEVPCLPRNTTSQPALTPWKRRAVAASPIDTVTAEENQRIETRHAGASKRVFHGDFLMFKLCSFKIYVFLRVFS